MDRSAIRDNILYKLDSDYLSDRKQETRIKSFELADYLPNSVRKKGDWQSSLSSNRNEGSMGLFNGSTYCDSSTMPPIRHGSVSDLGSALSSIGRSINPSMSQLGIMKYNSSTSKASLAVEDRSTTISAFGLPANVVPVEDSFLFFDKSKNRLSDLGLYKKSMRGKKECPEAVNDMFDRNK